MVLIRHSFPLTSFFLLNPILKEVEYPGPDFGHSNCAAFAAIFAILDPNFLPAFSAPKPSFFNFPNSHFSSSADELPNMSSLAAMSRM
jgi:hypothetical protein